ncbi:MAG: hypothetical protein HYX92_13140 [Chloroflexi bacterium]|nr:hypothetical protein [Chloroflexota bacterium]
MKSGFGKLVLVVFVFGLGIGGAFGAGTVWGSINGAGKTTTSGATAQANAGAGAGQTGAAFGAQGRGTTGTIDKVEGSVLTITTQQGPARVNMAKDATITAMKQVAADELKVGARILVTGDKQGDGSINATAIQLMPERAGRDAAGAESGAGSGRTGGAGGAGGSRTRQGSNP